MTLVYFQKIDYHDEPFIMAHQASQVFYIQDPTSKHCFVVLHGKKNNIMTQKIQTMTFVRLNHLQERPSIKSTRMLLMLYMQLEMIIMKEYIFVCACDSCLVIQYIIFIIFHILNAYYICLITRTWKIIKFLVQ